MSSTTTVFQLEITASAFAPAPQIKAALIAELQGLTLSGGMAITVQVKEVPIDPLRPNITREESQTLVRLLTGAAEQDTLLPLKPSERLELIHVRDRLLVRSMLGL